MLIRLFPKLILFIGPLLILGYTFFIYFGGDFEVKQALESIRHGDGKASSKVQPDEASPTVVEITAIESAVADLEASPAAQLEPPPSTQEPPPIQNPPPTQEPPPSTQEPLKSQGFSIDDAGEAIVDTSVYREVFSASTPDRKYFALDFGPDHPTMNPNIIPHPHQENTWIMIAVHARDSTVDHLFVELACNAHFREDGVLACTAPPTELPVAPTQSEHCQGDLVHFTLSVGPHDMRVFYGPDAPFAVFGSQSAHTCFGLWVQDFRTLIDDFQLDALNSNLFAQGTELQRPAPWHEIEKNWFLFWDTKGQAYVHHDMEPKRVFAQLAVDGAVGPDLAPLAAANDDACMAKYMPKRAPENENLHQATNALSITLCKRSDPNCKPSDENTFVMTIFQHKKYYSFHSVYEPYIMLFQQSAPFAVHAISTKPIWIHGRRPLTKETAGTDWEGDDTKLPEDQSQMFYITSASWKAHGQKYHGYVDDVLFVGFGIEDSRTAAIDVVAGDLLQDMGLCIDVGV